MLHAKTTIYVGVRSKALHERSIGGTMKAWSTSCMLRGKVLPWMKLMNVHEDIAALRVYLDHEVNYRTRRKSCLQSQDFTSLAT